MIKLSMILCVLSSCIFLNNDLPAYQAEIEYIPDRDYFETALEEINQARESIKVYMFVIAARPDQPGSKVMRLLDALVAAKDRGVDVTVHVDQNVPFGQDPFDGGVEGKNENAYAYLKGQGVKIFVDNPYSYAHAKAVIIDGQTAIVGSSNWSASAFEQNNETNALIRSEEYAKELLTGLGRIESRIQEFPEDTKSAVIPEVFTTREDLMGQMVTRQDERAYDIYLWLLMTSQNEGSGDLTVNYDELAGSLGIDEMTREAYRRQISKVLRKLEDEYGLITLKTAFDEPAEVSLVHPDSPETMNEVSQKDASPFPETYWRFGWNRRLSFPGKVMLLVNWKYSEGRFKSWHQTVKNLAEIHHISETFIKGGTQELRNFNLIDVRYKELPGSEETPKQHGVYSPNEIYDPMALEKRFDELASKEGKETLRRARKYAEVIFKQNDYESVLTLIGLEKQYGQGAIEGAVEILAAKRTSTPKRHMGYLVGTIKGIAEGAN